jgi:hypothetical protein
MKLNVYKLALFIPALIATVILAGCDQNAFDEDLGIPDGDGTPYVEFQETADTVALFKSDSLRVDVQNRISVGDSIIVDFRIADQSDAVFNTDYAIAERRAEAGTDSEVQEIRIVPGEEGAIDPDNPPDNVTLLDTLENGVIIASREVDQSTPFVTTFDAANLTGQMQIRSNPLTNVTDEATVTLFGLGNPGPTEPRSVVLEITDAQTGDGGEVLAGRRGTTPDGQEGVVGNRLTVLFGQADVAASSTIQFGEIPSRDEEPYTSGFTVVNFASGDLPTTLSNFRIVGQNAEAFSFIGGTPGDIVLQPGQFIQPGVALDASEPGTTLATLQIDVSNDFDVRTIEVDLSAVIVE